MRAAMIALVLALGLVACDDGDGGSGGPATFEEFKATFISTLCDVTFRCTPGDGPGSTVLRRNAVSADECPARLQMFADQLEDSVNAGKATYDADAAAACLVKMRGSCGVLESGDPACEEGFVGTVALGAACTSDNDCVGDAYCADRTGGWECPGVCTAPTLELGDDCSADGDACKAAGATGRVLCYADEVRETRTCLERRAASDAALGATCGVISTEAFVQTYASCEAGLWCQDHVCAAPLAADAACSDSDDVCVEGRFCHGRACVALTVADRREPSARKIRS